MKRERNNMTIEELVDNFSACGDWEEKYAYLIDLGEALPPMDAALKTDTVKVRGCMSQVWMVLSWNPQGRLALLADSDAAIVRGLIAVLIALFNGKTREEAKNIDVEASFARLGLDEHLSPNRRNGFFSMVERVRELVSA
jgi:cysteine desulfuration protein SufE